MLFLPLTTGYVATIDDEDAYLADFRWVAKREMRYTTIYAIRRILQNNGKYTTKSLHRTILGITDPKIYVDHIDGDGLNNCRSNLRLVTHTENRRNVFGPRRDSTSGYLGVCWNKQNNKWVAHIRSNGRREHLGYFHTKEEAHKARIAAEKEAWGIQPRRVWAHSGT